jgi:hypothetical protein
MRWLYSPADGPLAQLVEQGTLNPKVEGSNPSRPISFAGIPAVGAKRGGARTVVPAPPQPPIWRSEEPAEPLP